MSITSQINPSQDTFVRREEKFLMPKHLIPQLEDLIELRGICLELAASSEEPNAFKKEKYFVDSIYYDSPEQSLYQDHFASNQKRYKLRERRYSSSSEMGSEQSTLLELKVKENDVCTKSRLKIGEKEIQSFRKSLPIQLTKSVRALNKKNDSHHLSDLLENINEITRKHSLRPVGQVSYFRKAFEETGFRMTYDQNLSFMILNPVDSGLLPLFQSKEWWTRAQLMFRNFDKERHTIVELKHSGVIPEWIAKFFASQSIRPVSFSKYCFSITEHFNLLPQPLSERVRTDWIAQSQAAFAS